MIDLDKDYGTKHVAGTESFYLSCLMLWCIVWKQEYKNEIFKNENDVLF